MPRGRGKIAIFLHSLSGGGVERVRVNLSREFIRRGHEVDMVLARAEGSFLAEVPPGVRVVDLKARRIRYSLLPLVRYLREVRPAAMLSATPNVNIIALLAMAIAGVPLRSVVSMHNIFSIEAKQPPYLWRLMPRLARHFYPGAHGVVAVSRGVAEDLAEVSCLPKESIKIINNPVLTNELSLKAKEPLGHRFFASSKPPVILAAGRLVPQKDFPTLLRAFAYVRERVPARLVILGEGEKSLELEGLINELGLGEYVDMPGFVENPYAYMSRAAVFAMSSLWEGFPNVLLESMACGCPVVSTDCPGGPAEILDGGKYGSLVPVGDARSLGEAILKYLELQPDTENLRARAAEFSIDKTADQYLELLFPD